MRESYCGLCDDCQLGHAGFLDAVSRLKEYVDQFRANVWIHCFPGDAGFSFPEFRRGLEWFLDHRECPGCKDGRGLDECLIRQCARARQLEHCYECPELGPCDKFVHLLAEFPDVKINLQRRQLKLKARNYHQKIEQERK